jgi:hypothetical protein
MNARRASFVGASPQRRARYIVVLDARALRDLARGASDERGGRGVGIGGGGGRG